jgi:hypothetical protein
MKRTGSSQMRDVSTFELIDFFKLARNEFSQNGEDGILEKLFEVEGVANGFFIEFGAWDGKYLSNAYALYKRGWTGCYIEGDERKYRDLLVNIPDANIKKVCAWVTSEGPTSLDRIVADLNVPRIDLLSIDIDSDDLLVWKGLRVAKPLVVVIEYNPTIPSDVLYENPPGAVHGNSPLSIAEFASSNGYTLLEGTATNLIFVRNGARVLDVARAKTLADVARQTQPMKYFFAYDGTLITSVKIGGQQVNELVPVPWTSPMCFFPQPLPKFLRRYSSHVAARVLKFVYRALLSIAFHPFASLRLFGRYLDRRSRGAHG